MQRRIASLFAGLGAYGNLGPRAGRGYRAHGGPRGPIRTHSGAADPRAEKRLVRDTADDGAVRGPAGHRLLLAGPVPEGVRPGTAVQGGRQRQGRDDRHRRLLRLPEHPGANWPPSTRASSFPRRPASRSSGRSARCRRSTRPSARRWSAGRRRRRWTSSTPTRWRRGRTSCWWRPRSRRPWASHGFPQIVKAENYVINHHLGTVISQSFAAPEETFPNAASIMKLRSAYVNAAKNGVTVLAAPATPGPPAPGPLPRRVSRPRTSCTAVADWPATDPLVTAVGGTQLHLDAAGNAFEPATVWNDTQPVRLTGRQHRRDLDRVPPPGLPGQRVRRGRQLARRPGHLDERGRGRRRAGVPRRRSGAGPGGLLPDRRHQ